VRQRLALGRLLATLSLVCAAPAAADLGGFVIDRFHADLTVERNGDLLVEERIEVDFVEPRRGIYRTIPVRYTDPKGYAYSYRFRLLGVTDDDGRPHRTQASSEGRYRKIRIGDPDRTVRGRVVYVVRYRVGGALARFPEHDELYWNATGNEWPAPIREASATVRLPEAIDRSAVEATAFTGGFGATGRDVEISPNAGGVEFRVTRPLERLEGLTIAVAWPPGVVELPGPARRAALFFADNWILLAPFAALAFLWRRWRRSGRDPDAGAPVVVRYEPPENLTPAEIGALVDESLDPRDLTATIVDLAIRGHLVIRTEEESRLLGLVRRDETVFERAATPPADELRPHESAVLTGLFQNGSRVELSELRGKFYTRIPAVRESLFERLVAAGYFAASPAAVRQQWTGFGFLAGILTLLAGVAWAGARGGIWPHSAVVPAVAAAATLGLFAAFAPAMPRRTKSGVRMRSWALGFEEFVERVEKDRLERLDPRTVFERLLPYAMALGVSARFAEKFEGIYDERPPTWYVGRHDRGGFSVRSFERNLSSSMRQAGAGLAAAPRSHGSSGFGGGGFSGGGGGGGGGGSW